MKKMFKNRNTKRGLIGLSIVAMLSATSCSKYTELNSSSSPSDITAFTTAGNVELVAAGLYSKGALGFYNATIGGANTPRGYAFGAASIEQEEMRGEDMVNLQTFYAITYQNTYDATTANNVNMWGNLFSLINQCNVLIKGAQGAGASGVITAAVAKQYEAEARFLRALSYHEAVILFCRPYLDGAGSNPGVPYHTVAVTTPETATSEALLQRGTVAQDYTLMLADLDFAEANLPATRTNQISRATSGAAIALKTRIKLHMGDWAGVIAEGTKLGTSALAGPYTSPIGAYKLTALPDGPFLASGPNGNGSNTESIFSFEESAAANPGVNAALASLFGPASVLPPGAVSATTGLGRALVCTSPNLYNASFWVAGDLRRSLLQVQGATANYKFYFSNKYHDYVNFTDWSPILRYAEVLLNVSEAYSRTTALSPNALALLNAVRNRSVPVASQFTIASFLTQNSLTQAILNERRIEFAGEGRRWADISRLANDPNFAVGGGGVPAKVLYSDMDKNGADFNLTTRPTVPANQPALPYTNFRFLWPIPVTETNANPILAAQQNPGYQ